MNNERELFLKFLYQRNMDIILERQKKLHEFEISTKSQLILIGEKSVGKSSILSYLEDKEFDPNIEKTEGARYSEISYYLNEYDKYFGYCSWDTSGDKKYRKLIEFFMKERQVFILVYDITKRDTFNALRDFWIDKVKKNLTSNSGK